MTKPHSHANPAFDRDIKKMSKLLGEMEGAVKYQLVAVSEAFARLDLAQSRKICKNDKTINNIRQELEEQTILLLARHQPMADDLRHITGAFKASIEYERMGDYVKHFAKSVGKFAAHHESLEVFPALAEMETAVRKMYDDFLAAKKDDNTDAACKVWLSDQKIDDMCHAVVQEAFINQKRGDGNPHSLVHAVSVAKNLERIGDKIKNLVEIFYYENTGLTLNLEIGD